MPNRRFLPPTLLLVALFGLASFQSRALAQTPTDAPYEVAIQKKVMVPVRDGTKLALDVYLPAKNDQAIAGKFPTLLTRTPYGRGGVASEGKWFAARGYVVVANDTRGRYDSEGKWRMMVDDMNDGADILAWVVKQPWCNGKVGTFGTSYVGGTQHALACANPPGLACMVPTDSLSNAGVAGMRHSGAFELRFFNWIFNQSAADAKDPATKTALTVESKRVTQHLLNLPIRLGTSPLKHVPEYEAWLVEAMTHSDNDAYWKQPGFSVIENVDKYADVPVYHVTGWYDSWCRQNTMNWMALSKAKKSPQFLIIGPWTHGQQRQHFAGEVEFPPEAALDFNAWRKRWYDRWLAGIDNGIEKEAPVKLFVMGGGSGLKSKDGRLLHGGHWRDEKTFPLERTQFTPYYIHANGTLSPSKPVESEAKSSTYTFEPRDPVPSIGGNISSFNGILDAGGFDQRCRPKTAFAWNELPLSERRDVLVFQTEPLKEATEVTGPIEVKLFVSSTAVDTDFTAKLIDVYPPNSDYPLGFDLNIGDSITRMRYRNSLEKAELMKPCEVYEVTIHIYPTSNVFAKGHRIRLDISSSNFPRFDVNPNTGEPLQQHRRMVTADNTLWHESVRASHVLLPVVPGK